MRRALATCSLDVPDAWEDLSLYQFVSPAAPSLAEPRLSAKGAQLGTLRGSVVVARVPLRGELGPHDVLAQQVQAWRALPGYTAAAVDEPAWTHPDLGALPTASATIDVEGVRVQQVAVVLAWPAQRACSIVTVACAASAFNARRATFTALVASARAK